MRLETGALTTQAEAIIHQAILSAIVKRPKLSVSEWADKNRALSPESSAEPGRWFTERAEYQRGIMDAFSDPTIEQVVVMSSSQLGKTEILLNVIGYYIDQDPCSILVIQPTLDNAKTFSKERLKPMLRDTKTLAKKISVSERAKKTDDMILHKIFIGGYVAIAGANSPASLAARPIRVLLCDEVDRYPISAGAEGDPVNLAMKRTTAFWNRKIGMFSTPTRKGLSRIELAYELSDKRKFHVPCPHCGQFQPLRFENLSFSEHDPSDAVYICPFCKGVITDTDKYRILKQGKWIPEKSTGKIAGFWINELYSPWVSFANLAYRYIEAKKKPETMQVFVNTSLGETWEEEGEQIEDTEISKRREDYETIPEAVAVLTAACDIQDDRIEVLVVGWGAKEESWHIEHRIFYGPTIGLDVWNELDDYLQKTFVNDAGMILKISCVAVDSGYLPKKVYDFVKKRQSRRIYAVKGANSANAPLVNRPRLAGKERVKLFQIGTQAAKDILFSRLRIDTFGPGYIHFPRACDDEYFKQLTAERVRIRLVKGFAVREYEKIRPRNEILDLWVYNIAAYAIINPDVAKIKQKLAKISENKAKIYEIEQKQAEIEQKQAILDEKKAKKPFALCNRRLSSWVKGWK